MELTMKFGQRELARVAMALLTKQGEKAQKILTVLALSTADVDALLSRAGLVVEAVAGPAEIPVHLAHPLRVTLRQGLTMYLAEVEATQEDELKLGIEPEGSEQKADEIKALAAEISEQLTADIALAQSIRRVTRREDGSTEIHATLADR